jgi:asparagine synthase (glutamine-hydrolysing)
VSAICGVVHVDGTPGAAGELDGPMAAMAHYGVDGSGLWSSEVAALGHQMMWVTPESRHEPLPYHDPEVGLTITADARLDNRDELFSALRVPQFDRMGMPDSRLILLAYLKWGEDTPIHLLGDFAFAVWDERKRRLFCARDILGVMPLYYHYQGGRFAFASDIQAMLDLEGVLPVLDLTTLAGYLDRRPAVHLTRSFYRDVAKLPPAHALVVDAGGLRQWAYWHPEDAPNVRYRSDEDYVEALRDLLHQAVACRLRANYPIGAHVSGGLDSSTVAVLAARALRAEGRQLTMGYSCSPPLREGEDYLPGDERLRVDSLSAQEGFPIRYVDLTPEDGIAPLLRDITVRPTETLLKEQVVARLAGQAGVRVILSGWGGDELISFNGRGFYAEMFWHGHWRTLWREAASEGRSLWRVLGSQVFLPLVPAKIRRALRPAAGRRFHDHSETLSPYVSPALEARLRLAGLGKPPRDLRAASVREMQLGLLRNGHLSWRLESWACEGATHTIQYRYPLLDRRILEFAMGLPATMYVREGRRRYVFQRAAADILPADVLENCSKRDPAVGVHESLRPQSAALLLDVFRARKARMSFPGFVDYDALTTALTSLSERKDPESAAASGLLVALVLASLGPAAILDRPR